MHFSGAQVMRIPPYQFEKWRHELHSQVMKEHIETFISNRYSIEDKTRSTIRYKTVQLWCAFNVRRCCQTAESMASEK